MAIILDTNCFSHVFNPQDKEHGSFSPVLNWIIYGNGFFVYGGTKYLNELKKCKRYHKIFRLLKDMNKVIHFKNKDKKIDEITDKLNQQYGNEDFDDPHLPAIVLVTKCKLICSTDVRSMPYVRNSKMYPKNFGVPMYYTCEKDQDLLIDKNIDKRLLRYRCSLNKEKKNKIEKVISPLEE